MRNAMLIDYNWCSGCHSCEVACQQEHGFEPDVFGIELKQIGPDQLGERKWQYDNLPVPTDRCDGCARRRGLGKPPACVQMCQAGCIQYGPLKDMAEKAEASKKGALFV